MKIRKWTACVARALHRILHDDEPIVIHEGHVPVYPVGHPVQLVTFCFVSGDAVLPENAEVISDPEVIELWAKMLDQTRMVNEELFGLEHPDSRSAASQCRSPERRKLVRIPMR